ncbi:hypothetical protein [Mycobacterium sp. 94-17]|uniref:hypothetical protein n=1 Tax=Mycobacterium sp. 94-17 TaxID=2986147 RepID=UPI002D1F8021|nr:hypothetical protein [Mycobacterium sp. 94-17]MEB4208765.1 hypothetical protein [Mycobacterium sp. 94-17]
MSLTGLGCPTSEDAANYRFRRILDAAEDRPSDEKLKSVVLREIASLDSAQQEDVIAMLAAAIGRLFARQRPSRAGRKDFEVVNRAVGVILAEARQCTDPAALDRLFKQLGNELTKRQLLRVAHQLAVELVKNDRTACK